MHAEYSLLPPTDHIQVPPITVLPADQNQVTTLPLSLTCEWSVTVLPADQTQVTTLLFPHL